MFPSAHVRLRHFCSFPGHFRLQFFKRMPCIKYILFDVSKSFILISSTQSIPKFPSHSLKSAVMMLKILYYSRITAILEIKSLSPYVICFGCFADNFIDSRFKQTWECMMTSSNGNIFHVTGPLCREFTGHRTFDVFFDVHLHKRLSKQSRCWWFETPAGWLWRHCNGHCNSKICMRLNYFYFVVP